MIEQLLEQTGAIKKGHFLLASGYHSEYYFQAQSLLQYPEHASTAGKEIANLWKDEKIDAVISLAIGGIVIGQEVARHIGVRHVFFERKKGTFSLERGFQLKKGERVLLVEDVITTGGSIKEVMPILNNYEVEIAGITSMVLRGEPGFQYDLRYLLKIDWPKYSSSECPLCKAAVPLYAPGTKQSKK
jgi:orotate phosphoribosyltransferase